MVLGYGFKRLILDNSIFYPHAENVRVFRSLVFCASSPPELLGMRHVVSSGSFLSLISNLRRGTSKRPVKLSLSHSIVYLLRATLRPIKKFQAKYKIIMRYVVRLKWRLRKNRRVLRRLLGKVEARVRSVRPPSIRILERYNMPRFFTFSTRNISPAPVASLKNSKRNSAALPLWGIATGNYSSQGISKEYALLYFFFSPLFFKVFFSKFFLSENSNAFSVSHLFLRLTCSAPQSHVPTNVLSSIPLRSVLVKKILSNQTNSFLSKHALP